MGSRDEGKLVPKLVWRARLVAEFETGETTEVEVARLERDEQAGLADLGLRLAEAQAPLVAPSASVHRIQEAQTTMYNVLWELCQAALDGGGAVTAP